MIPALGTWPRAAVFDLDGTLIDSAPDVAAAANVALAPVGIRAGTDEVRGWLGEGARALIEKALRDHGLDADEERLSSLTEDFVVAYQTNPVIDTAVFPGALEAVAGLAARGIGMAVCTNKPESVARRVLDVTGLGRHIEVLVGGGAHALKPDPAGLHACLEVLGVAPHEAAYIGDQAVDIATGRAAGVPVVAAVFGYARTSPHALGADAVLHDWSGLDAALANIARGVAAGM